MLPGDGDNPNHNPLYGRKIVIQYNGNSAEATIADTCPGCEGYRLKLTTTLIKVFADLDVGRVSDVEWWYV